MKSIGAVYTPAIWAEFAVSRAGLVEKWLAGRTILDPTMGTGNLLEALVDSAIKAGHRGDLPFHLLFGIEIDPESHGKALSKFQTLYGVDMTANFRCADLFETSVHRCSILFGNPPWMNFTNLPDDQKAIYKERFVRYGLVPDTRRLLLGGSRVDVAALVVQKTLGENLEEGGEAWFFLPLSLFLNDGAHSAFRRYRTGGVPFAPRVLYDFSKEKVFAGVSTRHGLVGFDRDSPASFPIPYHQRAGETWLNREAGPVFQADDPLSVATRGETHDWATRPRIRVPARSLPRQGVNTGGANGVYFFHRWHPIDDETCLVDGEILLPRARVHPLITRHQFLDASAPAQRWVLLPYDDWGRPLSPAAVGQEPLLSTYLESHRRLLESRKGELLAALRDRGLWWALLGVGPYSFAPFKVVWEALGRHTFRPHVRAGTWQANQSLQAYIPCWSQEEATRIVGALADPSVEAYLKSLNMGGTMNWAQPGKLKKFLEIDS